MERPRGHREDCRCPVCQNYRRWLEAQGNATPQSEETTAEPEREEEEEPTRTPPQSWAEGAQHPRRTVFIETGRGQTAEVEVGAPFSATVERISEEANYGGYFRVFLNGREIVRPEEAPPTIEADMRIAITAYDKVG